MCAQTSHPVPRLKVADNNIVAPRVKYHIGIPGNGHLHTLVVALGILREGSKVDNLHFARLRVPEPHAPIRPARD